jgi:hypothetical protein
MKITRRALAALAVAPAALSVGADPQAPAPPRADPAGNASVQFQAAARQLAGVKLPRSVEPAFRFEA